MKNSTKILHKKNLIKAMEVKIAKMKDEVKELEKPVLNSMNGFAVKIDNFITEFLETHPIMADHKDCHVVTYSRENIPLAVLGSKTSAEEFKSQLYDELKSFGVTCCPLSMTNLHISIMSGFKKHVSGYLEKQQYLDSDSDSDY